MIRFGMCNELFEGWDFAQVCKTLKGLGYEGIEIAPFTLGERPTEILASRRAELRRIVADAGLETIGTHWLLAKTNGYYLTHPDAEVRKRTGDYLVALAELTRDLGGSLMVLGSPKQRDLLPGVTTEAATAYAEEVFGRIAPQLGEIGVTLCLEPLAPAETDFLNTCDEANALIARVNHPNLVLHMDVKAQSAEPEATVPELIRRHAAKAGHFHAQDSNRRGPGMGDVDFVPILRALVESGYDRWVSVEVFDYSPGAVETSRISIGTLRSARDAANER
ncbi:MAG TPA: sugar phosphate isomerase/epimerase [Isosphaeraceae bacterium]